MSISQSNLQSCHTFCIRTQREVVGNMYGNIFSSSPLKSPITGLQHVTCPNYFFPNLSHFQNVYVVSIFIGRRSADYHTWGVACATPFGFPQVLTFIYSFRPKALPKCWILPERHVIHFRRIWGWYFKCAFWLPKIIKLYVLNIRDGAELESVNCLKAHDFSRFWHHLVSDRLVTLSSPENVSKLGVCVRPFKSQVLNLYI